MACLPVILSESKGRVSGGCFLGVDAGDFIVPAVRTDVRVGSRRGDHVGVYIQADALEKIDQSDALNHLAGALMLKCVLGEEVNYFLSEFDQRIVVLVGL